MDSYYKRNRERILQQKKVYYSLNKENILEYQKQYYLSNLEKIKDYKKEYHQENKEILNEISAEYRNSHVEDLQVYFKLYHIDHKDERSAYHSSYYQENKLELNSYSAEYQKNRRQEDVCFSLRKDVSKSINYYLFKNKSDKGGISIMKFLTYSIEDLKIHLEKLFEPWMSWDNRGVYNLKTWDDNNPSTWTWNIDHIIPQSDLPYKSMEDDNFKKCWALENLRPYSAKQNLIDGSSRVRHGLLK